MGIAMLVVVSLLFSAFVVNGFLENRVGRARGVVELRSYHTAGIYWPGKPQRISLPGLRMVEVLPDGTRRFAGSRSTFTLAKDRLSGLPYDRTGLLPSEIQVRAGAPPDYPPSSTVIWLDYPTPPAQQARFEFLGGKDLKTAVRFAQEANAMIAYRRDHPAPAPAERPWWDQSSGQTWTG